jgi:hypothetical protein
MAEQPRVPNLQELDEQQAYRFLTELLSTKSREEVYEANHAEDYIMEMPQSGEAIRGRENMRRFQEAHPGGAPSLRLRRVLVREGLWVVSLYLQGKRRSSKGSILVSRDNRPSLSDILMTAPTAPSGRY